MPIPEETPAKSYRVQANTEEGETAQADLTVAEMLVGAAEHNAEAISSSEPSAEAMVLERPQTARRVIGFIVAAMTSLTFGIWLAITK